MMKYYEIEGLDFKFKTLYEAKNMLRKTLESESNYEYFANKNNTYAILEVLYDEKDDYYTFNEILPRITVSNYKNMTYEEKEKYFNN